MAAIQHTSEHGPAPFAWHLPHALRGFLHTRRVDVDFMAAGRAGLRAAEAVGHVVGQILSLLVLAFADNAVGAHERVLTRYELVYQLSEARAMCQACWWRAPT